MTDLPDSAQAHFASDDPDLLEPGPFFACDGEYIDPAQQGYAIVYNYAAYFWRPYLGNTAFALWELLVSFCYGDRDVAFPSISRLARMLTNSDHSRAVVTGRSRPSPSNGTGRSLGALEVLRRERLVQVRRRGRGATARYTFHILKTLPLLRPEQLAQLSPKLQYDHAIWLERYDIDEATYRQAYDGEETASTLAEGEIDAPGSTLAASGTPGAASAQPAAAPDSTNNLLEDQQIGEWWDDTLDSLRLQMTRGAFFTYLLRTRPLAYKDGELTVQACNPLQQELLECRLARMVLRELAEASAGQVRSVRFVPPPEEPDLVPRSPARGPVPRSPTRGTVPRSPTRGAVPPDRQEV